MVRNFGSILLSMLLIISYQVSASQSSQSKGEWIDSDYEPYCEVDTDSTGCQFGLLQHVILPQSKLLKAQSQATVSQRSESYEKLMGLVRKHMSTVQHEPTDLTECGAKLLFSKDDVYGDLAEILQLSGEVSNLYAGLTEQEKAKFPKILMAEPGTFAMKFYASYGYWKPERYIMTTQPTEADLDEQCHKVRFASK